MGELFLKLRVYRGLEVILLPVEELVKSSQDNVALVVED